MATDIIRYDLLVQDALRGVVRKVLSESSREGLPGEHHYYITFRTDAPGVRLSTRMREKYPGEMTIILQHQFWDLSVTEQNFEVGLSFNNIPERLLIPFEAITGFFDPSVQFGLKFEVQETSPEAGANDTEPKANARSTAKLPRGGKTADKIAEKTAEKPAVRGAHPNVAEHKPAAKPTPPPKSGKGGADSVPRPLVPAESDMPAKVVSIDAFRKKP